MWLNTRILGVSLRKRTSMTRYNNMTIFTKNTNVLVVFNNKLDESKKSSRQLTITTQPAVYCQQFKRNIRRYFVRHEQRTRGRSDERFRNKKRTCPRKQGDG